MVEQNCLWVLCLVFLVRSFSCLPGNPSADLRTAMPPRHCGDTRQTSIHVAQWDLVHNDLCWGRGVGLFMPINAIFNFC